MTKTDPTKKTTQNQSTPNPEQDFFIEKYGMPNDEVKAIREEYNKALKSGMTSNQVIQLIKDARAAKKGNLED
jgi:hypothetical protein